jgi:hypothetical protein
VDVEEDEIEQELKERERALEREIVMRKVDQVFKWRKSFWRLVKKFNGRTQEAKTNRKEGSLRKR